MRAFFLPLRPDHMRLLYSKHRSAPHHLALEELLLKHRVEDFLLLYINDLCVVCGKHQNILAEVAPWYCHENGIPLYRRISGGGTVVHDPGNINFSYILNSSEGKQVDFEKYTSEIIGFLRSLGLDASFGGHNSILCNGLKISGNAEHVWKNRVLHHGTLLFDANLEILSACLTRSEAKYMSKAVESVPATVGNIASMLGPGIKTQQFLDYLLSFMEGKFAVSREDASSFLNDNRLTNLVTDKYSNIEWICGYSPAYKLENSIVASGKRIKLSLKVRKGRIEEALIFDGIKQLTDDRLQGIWHTPLAFDELAEKTSLKGRIDKQEMRNLFF